MSRTMIVLIVLVITHGGLWLWGYREHEHRLTAEDDLKVAQVQLEMCKQSAAHQNDAIEELQRREADAQARAASASKEARTSAAQAAKEHAKVQALIDKPTQEKSCDAAWDEIEQGS